MRLLAVALILVLVGPAAGLDATWDRFDDSVVDWPCVREPGLMLVVDWLPGGMWGSYRPWFPGGLVQVRSDAPAWVAVHEFAHHLWSVCHVERRLLGRRFLAAVDSVSWGYREREWFAATLTWLLTGRGRQDIRRDAAPTLTVLLTERR